MITGLDLYDKYGDPNTRGDEGNYLEVWNVPEYIWKNLPVIPRRIYCHSEIILPLEIAFLNIIERGLSDELKTWDGCFNIRAIRGYDSLVKKLLANGEIEKAMIYMSVHSWAWGIDVNAFENGLGKEPKLSKEFVRCFEDGGFEWGGNWRRKDGMHFQLSYIR